MLTWRLHARLATFTVLLLVFALLPFLATSSQGGHPRQALLLSAEARAGVDAPAAVQGVADGATASARQSSELEARAGLLMIADVATAAMHGHGQSTSAEGGGLVLFPNIDMASMSLKAFESPVAQQDGFIRPIAGPEVSGFGPRMHPVLGRAMFHTGIDLMAACGTPIRAAAAGTVEYAENSVSWGNRTIIAHSPTLKTAYGHQSKFLVHEGDVVAQGQIIGLVGTTGWSTGCHLHWDVILDGRYVDPAPYLGLPASHATTIPFSGSGTRSTGTNPSSTINGSPAAATPIPDGDVSIPIQSAPTGTSTSTQTGTPTGTHTGTPTGTHTGTPTGTQTSTPTGTQTSTPTGTKTGTPGTTTTSSTAPAPATSTTTSSTAPAPAPTTSTSTSTSSSAATSTEPTSTTTGTPTPGEPTSTLVDMATEPSTTSE